MQKWIPCVKVGPKDWQQTLEETGAKHCEVWYRIDQEETYQELFSYLQEHRIAAGLHFWGILKGSIMPNVAYPDPAIWKSTLELITHNLEVAAQHHSAYVNIHVGNAALELLDFDKHKTAHIEGSEIAMELAEKTAVQNITKLNEYAKKIGVKLIIETIPPYDPNDWNAPESRFRLHNTHGLSNVFIERLGRDYGIAVNNDISHTAAECITNDRETLWRYLLDRTRALAPYTALIHANTLRPPFNGTDSHDGILDTDFARGVFPTKTQFAKLLNIFARRGDVWIVNEPQRDHVQNFFALKRFNGQT